MRSLRSLSTAAALGTALVLVLAPSRAWADDIEFYATADPQQITLNDTVLWQIVLQGNTGDAAVELPVMDEWTQVSKSHSSSTQINLGGGGSQIMRQTTVKVILAPARTGTLPIAPAHVRINGKDYQTSTLSVKVLPGGATPPSNKRQGGQQPDPDPLTTLFGGNPFAGMQGMGGQDPFAGMMGEGGPPKDSDLFVRASLDKKQAYLGEQVTLSMYLFSRIDIAEVKDLKPPKLDAFFAEDIEAPNQLSGEVRQVNGVAYRVFLLRRRALFALKSGKLAVEPTEVDVVTGMSIFGNGHKSHRASQPLELDVLPLPAGAPPGFDSTNVGNWRMTLSGPPGSNGVLKTTVGNPVTLDLVIEGTGSYRNLALPKMPTVRGLHIFDPTTTDKAQIHGGRFGGRRTLEFLVSPEQTGSFEIPPFTLSYFNPDTKTYETAKTAPVRIDVDAGAGGTVSVVGPNGVSQPSQVSILSNAGQLKPIHTLTDNHRLTFIGEPLHRRGYFLPLLGLPFGLYFLLATAGAMRERSGREDPTKRGRGAQGRARKRFKGAEALLESGDAGAYYGAVSKALHDYLSDKLGCPVAGLTRDELHRKLQEAGATEASVAAVAAVLEACDLGRFAPGAKDARRKVLEDGAAVVTSLESQKLKRVARIEVTA